MVAKQIMKKNDLRVAKTFGHIFFVSMIKIGGCEYNGEHALHSLFSIFFKKFFEWANTIVFDFDIDIFLQ